LNWKFDFILKISVGIAANSRFLIELIAVISLKKESGETMKSNPEKPLAISF
jgi:hypothetical protein